jgi:hypothetical protein
MPIARETRCIGIKSQQPSSHDTKSLVEMISSMRFSKSVIRQANELMTPSLVKKKRGGGGVFVGFIAILFPAQPSSTNEIIRIA